MKRILMNVLGLVLIAGALTTTSCKKGDEGPAGPKGDSAIANVYYSAWSAVTFNTTTGAATITAPKVTQDILDKGDVRVYFNWGSAASPQIFSLPCDFNVTASDGTTVLQVKVIQTLALGKINLFAAGDIDPSTETVSGVVYAQYRYIVIPGGVKVARLGSPAINWSDYAEVKAYLGLKD
jgi:hypothetical protein